MNKIRWLVGLMADFLHGLHSRIPLCCNLAFCRDRWFVGVEEGVLNHRAGLDEGCHPVSEYNSRFNLNCQYVPCDTCLDNEYAREIKHCDPSCWLCGRDGGILFKIIKW